MKKLNLYLCLVAGLLLLPVEAFAQNVQVGAEQNRGVTSAAAVATDSTGKLKAATIAGAGAGLTTGPTSSVSGDCVAFTGTAGQIADNGAACATTYTLPTATSSTLGGVKPDGTTIADSSGAISCATATSSQLGCVKPDGTTITIASGVISAASASQSNFVSTAQNITASTFTAITNMVTPTIPVNTTRRGVCYLFWGQTSGNAAITIGAALSASGATGTIGMFGSISNFSGATTLSGTSTATVVSSTPLAVGSLLYTSMITFTVTTGATNPVTLQLYGYTATSGDPFVVNVGSNCGLLP